MFLIKVALLFCVVAYSAVGVTISLYFGSQTLVSSNLNWQYYNGFGKEDGKVSSLARIVSFFVVLFPAFDVASAFPLNAITLGNNLFSHFQGGYASSNLPGIRLLSSKSLFRLLSALPPILAASLDDSLGRITNFTGITGFFLAFIFPAILSIRSKIMLNSNGLPSETYYSSVCVKSFSLEITTIIFGSVLTLFTVSSLILFGVPES